MKIHKRLKDIRNRLSMTQKDLASKINFSAISVCHWEMGLKIPSLKAAIEIFKVAKKRGVYLTFEDFI